MRLHRYFKDHADTTLREKRLLLKKVSDFNDPFEFANLISCSVQVEEAEDGLRLWPEDEINKFLGQISQFIPGGKLKETTPRRRFAELFSRMQGELPAYADICQEVADRYFRVCCFSKFDVSPEHEILLWSHYANKHQGVRIEFEMNEMLPLAGVNYSEKRYNFDVSKAPDANFLREAFNQIFTTKSDVWGYEGEVRMVFNRDHSIEVEPDEDAVYYLDFPVDWVKSVDFGINCRQITIDPIASILRQDYPHVVMRKAFHHPEDYSIMYRALE